jgi:hypothetical protein
MTPEQTQYCDFVRPYAETVLKGSTVRFETSDPNHVEMYVSHPAIPLTTQGLPEMWIDLWFHGVSFDPLSPGTWTPSPILIRRAIGSVVLTEVSGLTYPQQFADFIVLSTPLSEDLPLYP